MSTRSVNNDRTLHKMRGDAPKPKTEDMTPEEKAASQIYSTGRRTAAGGKPAREKSAGVTVRPASSSARYKKDKNASTANMTKEERKAQKARLRSHEDQVDAVASILLHRDPSYAKFRKIWWILLGTGFVSILLAFLFQWLAQRDGNTQWVVCSVVFLVLSYVGIIGALILDIFKVGKMRKKYRAEAEGYTNRRMNNLLEEEAKRRAEQIEREGNGIGAKIKRFLAE